MGSIYMQIFDLPYGMHIKDTCFYRNCLINFTVLFSLSLQLSSKFIFWIRLLKIILIDQTRLNLCPKLV